MPAFYECGKDLQFHRDEAFAKQFEAACYDTFVAMPFSKNGNYDADAVYTLLKDEVHKCANDLGRERGVKLFNKPTRVSEHSGTAAVITDSIVGRILGDHFFVGDLTDDSPGVVVETGIALAFKPNTRVVLVTQRELKDLHFDMKGLFFTQYDASNLVSTVARALVDAACEFERESKDYVTQVSARLTSDALRLLSQFGRLQRDHGSQASLFDDPSSCGDYFAASDGRTRFQQAIRELLVKRLLWTDYLASDGVDHYGAHATELGWCVITHIWSDLRKPANARSGPQSSVHQFSVPSNV